SALSCRRHTPATTALSTLSLHDALPIFRIVFDLACLRIERIDFVLALPEADDIVSVVGRHRLANRVPDNGRTEAARIVIEIFESDRKSTRLNSSHVKISYAVFCLKKKNN